jgi:hypothetical protein
MAVDHAAHRLRRMSVSLSVCLVLVALAPVVTIVGYETVGHRGNRCPHPGVVGTFPSVRQESKILLAIRGVRRELHRT